MSGFDDKTVGHMAERVNSTTMDVGAADGTNAAIHNEHRMTVRQSLRFWWKAIVFSFVISLAVVMEGYDTSLMNKFFAFEPFRNRFGDQVNPEGGMLVSSRWQTIILNGTQVCQLSSALDLYLSRDGAY
jgi:SP family general alpha glucoside:H+ symporter-like MFS transporter